MYTSHRLAAVLVALQTLLVAPAFPAFPAAPPARPAARPEQPLVLYPTFFLPAEVRNPTPLMQAAARRDLAKVRSLLAHKTAVDAVVEGRTALMVAAAYGDPRILRQLLAAGARVDARDDLGETALCYAVRTGHRAAVEALLARGADPNVQGRTSADPLAGSNPLTLTLRNRRASLRNANRLASSTRGMRQRRSVGDLAAYLDARREYVDGDWDGILDDLLAKGADPNRKDAQGDTPLLLARRQRDAALADRLRRAGARDEDLYAGLDPAQSLARAAQLCDLDQVRRFLAAGADLKAEGVFGYALGCPSPDLVRLLLDQGFDPGKPNEYGYNALTRAASAGRPQVVKLLLDRGLDPNSALAASEDEKQGKTPPRFGYDTALILAADAQDIECVQLLLDAGADPNRLGNEGTALFSAVKRNRLDLAKLLLDHGADPNLKRNGNAPLTTAAILGEREMAQLLLDHKADVNAKAVREDGKGSHETALFDVACSGNAAMVRLLLAAGADLAAMDQRHLTALDCARTNARVRGDAESREVLELLEEASRSGAPAGRQEKR